MYEIIKNMIQKNEKLYQYLRELKWGEKKRRYGGVPTQYFVLRRPSGANGIASDILVFLGQLKYMEEKYKGYQPVIDMQNYPQGISETTGESGNAWEDFFLQPNENHYGLQAVWESKSVILASIPDVLRNGYEIPTQIEYKELVKENWDYYFKKYIHLRADLIDRFQRDWNRLIENNKKIVGVKARGTDYVSLKPGVHSVQPTIEQIVEKLEDFLGRHLDYEYLFLATEDNRILDRFKEVFQDKLLVLDYKRMKYKSGAVLDNCNPNEISKKDVTTYYLEEIFLLSKCDSLICGNTSSLVPTLLWNEGKYEEVYIFNLGLYE